jgi:hypothetical protein
LSLSHSMMVLSKSNTTTTGAAAATVAAICGEIGGGLPACLPEEEAADGDARLVSDVCDLLRESVVAALFLFVFR